jgi:hypothetical protein
MQVRVEQRNLHIDLLLLFNAASLAPLRQRVALLAG